MKGVSSIIVALLILLVAVGLGGGFYVWSNTTAEDLKGNAEERIERDFGTQNADISVPLVANEGSISQVVVENTGKAVLNVTSFAVFINGVPESVVVSNNTSPYNETVLPGRSVIINATKNVAKCDHIMVTGQYETSDQYIYEDDGTCL